jgi:hypothetical protein
MVADFMDTNACIRGTAAKVDLASDVCMNYLFTPPAVDCYGQFWGAAIGMNLNQKLDMSVTPPVGAMPMPYDASALVGFSFVVSGTTVPAPSALRFRVESETTEFCNVPSNKLKIGVNTVLFTDLVAQCFRSPTPTMPSADGAKSGLLRLSWLVVTNTSSTVPYDFCISQVRAILK